MLPKVTKEFKVFHPLKNPGSVSREGVHIGEHIFDMCNILPLGMPCSEDKDFLLFYDSETSPEGQ